MLTSQRLDGNIGLNKIEKENASVLLKGVLNVPPPGECQFQPYLKISHCAIVKTIEINMATQIWR